MKNIFLSVITCVIIIATAVSCNQKSSKAESKQVADSTSVSDAQTTMGEKDSSSASTHGDHQHGESENVINESSTPKNASKSLSIASVVKEYLALKNSLVADNDKDAATAAKRLLANLNKLDMSAVPADKHEDYMDIIGDAKENAEHIGDNAGKIDHQREHLAFLSKDVNDLITLFGSPQKLYQDYCPMFNDGKGAIWISEGKEIKNPYLGSKMPDCGTVKKEYK
ncbi:MULTISPECIES: DUF3347 domain-containing protein [Chryseobacterium]|uniref:DUF3347 domain-containing protein n=1 Tax=Chryseobacterium aquaticum subsp. greenlandense TaxID=345663 RepID=A0A117KBQ8_9FLAO|nr:MULTISPECIES: DUF3347 domain-containing protein [Chryseobacterium]KNB61171.1 hypothetical protein AC804_11325 [Chryseobacterium sp. Hurlbut01]KUJ56366.1 hypothetical protein AR686_07325 [Chryseobacterium aquaticum subsp. greenlandense]